MVDWYEHMAKLHAAGDLIDESSASVRKNKKEGRGSGSSEHGSATEFLSKRSRPSAPWWVASTTRSQAC